MKWNINEFTKSGFSILLKPYENSIFDLTKITKAFSLAMKAHAGQYRNSGKIEPHINHSLRVALILTEELKLFDVNLICAALLHDILEKKLSKQADSKGILRSEFGDDVYNTVSTVTRPVLHDTDQDKDDILEKYFQGIAKGSKSVRYIKLADRLDNIRSLKSTFHKYQMNRYKEETLKYLIPIAENTDEKMVLKLSVALYELK
ncbi:MAG TPA: HD domain-containing protein [Nitrososphaeraceae archaeon]|jgi:GTP pyrophosphokinase